MERDRPLRATVLFTDSDGITASPSWHALALPEVCERLSATPNGLDAAEARRRLFAIGPNELGHVHRVSPWSVLLAQFQNLLILILLIATAVSAYLGEVVEAIAIGVIVGFAILLGFIQEYRAERAIAALRKMAAPVARVLRGGTETEVPAQDLVPGDVVLLGAGDKVPADGRLVEAINLKLNESALTGESVPVEKVQEQLAGDTLPLAERHNMVYAGTAYGKGRALLVATGMQTELGKITGLLKGVKASKTPLQENLDRVGRALAVAALAVVSLIVVLGLIRGASLMEMFMFGIALAVAVVPEALPAVVTISLALGVERMARRNALVRHLPAVETLGAITVILSDKTGTLTRDEMTARRLWVDGQEIAITGGGYTPEGRFTIDGAAIRPALPVMECLRAAALCSDARLIAVDGGFQVKGDPTEAALVVAAAKAGLDARVLENYWPRVGEIPFSSERKRMTTLHRGRSGIIACSKGAPEVILASCTRGRAAYGTVALDQATYHAVHEAAQAMAARALRVLAVAQKPNADIGDAECGMVLLGLIGLIDPPRAEAAQAIETCKAAGIRPVMITGDHPNTGAAIAKEIGLLRSGHVVTGAELEAMSAAELGRRVAAIEVYARVSPEHKLRVVRAWQQNGHIVAMTGDGVNDAPALKQADVGIAMGITGTEVSREAADMTLTDDNFASIVAAVEEGRAIFGNVKKYPHVPLVLEHRRDRAHGGRDARRAALAPERGADPLCQPRNRRPAGACARGRSRRARRDERPAQGPEGRDLHAARGVSDAGRRPVVDAGQLGALRLGPRIGTHPGAGHDAVLRVAGAHRARQGLQLPLRAPFRLPEALRQPLAQSGGAVGAVAALPDRPRALPAASPRYLPAQCRGVGDRHGDRTLGGPDARAGQVARARRGLGEITPAPTMQTSRCPVRARRPLFDPLGPCRPTNRVLDYCWSSSRRVFRWRDVQII